MNISIKTQFWHFVMQNLFIINRFEHIESEKSINFIVYNQNWVFDVFVRIHRNKNTTSHKVQFEQWVRINSILSKIKTYAKISTRKLANFRIMKLKIWIWRIYNSLNEHATNWRTCDMFDEFAMNHEHAIKFAIEQKIISYFYLLLVEKWLTVLKIYLKKRKNIKKSEIEIFINRNQSRNDETFFWKHLFCIISIRLNRSRENRCQKQNNKFYFKS